MEIPLKTEISRRFQKYAYRMLEPTIESIILSAKKSNNNEIELRKTISENISLYGGLYFYFREILPNNINEKKTCAKIASSFMSDKSYFKTEINLNNSSDNSFLTSSLQGLDKNSWSNPKERIKSHFSNLNFALQENQELEINTNKKYNSKIKELEEYTFDKISREEIIGNKNIINNLENIIISLLHYSPKEKSNLFDFNQYILFSGVPGTGKTLISKYLMSYALEKSEENNIDLKIVNLNFEDRWQNGPFENIKYQLETITQGKNPYIIFIDELDLKFPNRNQTNNQSENKVLGEILRFRGNTYPNHKNYLFLTTTNKPQNIDFALRDVFLEYKISLPETSDEKIDILKLKLKPYGDNINWNNIKPYLEKDFTGRKLYQISLDIKNKQLTNSKKIPLNKEFYEKKNILNNLIISDPISEEEVIRSIGGRV